MRRVLYQIFLEQIAGVWISSLSLEVASRSHPPTIQGQHLKSVLKTKILSFSLHYPSRRCKSPSPGKNKQTKKPSTPPSSCWILLSSRILSQLRQSLQYVDPWITEKVPIWNILSHSQPCVSMYFSKIWLLLIRKQEVLAVRIGNGGLNCQELLFQCSHVTVPNICQVTMHPSSFDCNRQCFIFISQTVGCHENYETSPIPPEDCIKPSCPNSELSLGNTYLVTSHKIVNDR